MQKLVKCNCNNKLHLSRTLYTLLLLNLNEHTDTHTHDHVTTEPSYQSVMHKQRLQKTVKFAFFIYVLNCSGISPLFCMSFCCVLNANMLCIDVAVMYVLRIDVPVPTYVLCICVGL